MARETLLSIVQEILSDMNSDPVNSISDTAEAMQVAHMVKATFMNIVNEREYPTSCSLFELTSSADFNRPSHMRIEDDVQEVDWVKYDKAKVGEGIRYEDVTFVTPRDFVNQVMARDPTKANVETVIDYHGTPLLIENDKAPDFVTSFDDQFLVFDSFDNTVDSILQASKTQVYGRKEPVWTMDDDFIPDLPSKAFPYLIAQSKAVAFIKIKEVASQLDMMDATRQRAVLSREKRRMNGGIQYPNYGRKGPGGGRYYRSGYRNDHFLGSKS